MCPCASLLIRLFDMSTFGPLAFPPRRVACLCTPARVLSARKSDWPMLEIAAALVACPHGNEIAVGALQYNIRASLHAIAHACTAGAGDYLPLTELLRCKQR